MLHLSEVKIDLNVCMESHLLSLRIGFLLEDGNNAKQEPVVLYN